ncbi:Imm19 family immunity protein [Acinetobacter guillouiae]|uniref:Imm19 family immunity protein n=1 Tax=Acinetobacter guillouiae TaxID=106649 RepID=UPI002FD99F03
MNQNHQQVAEQEISFSNVHFWHWFLLLFRGFDEEKELNLDEAIQEAVGLDPYNKELAAWYQSFLLSENNSIRNYQFSISADIWVDIQFAQEQINYYLNDLYIGNLGGHFEAWFFTLEEFLSFQLNDQHFLLLLAMLGVEPQQTLDAKIQISKRLNNIQTFQGQQDYIANCIVNGLRMNQEFYQDEQIGILNRQNHSMHNVELYPDDLEQIKTINLILKHD